MASSVTTNRPRPATLRAELPETGARVRRVVGDGSTVRKVRMVATCYIGLGMIVALAFLLRQVAPTAVAFTLFVIAAVVIVGALHPRRAQHTLRH